MQENKQGSFFNLFYNDNIKGSLVKKKVKTFFVKFL